MATFTFRILVILFVAGLLGACAGTDHRNLEPFEENDGERLINSGDGEPGDHDGDADNDDGDQDSIDDGDNDHDGDGDSEEPLPNCRIVANEEIKADEIPLQPGLGATYRVTLNQPFSTSGELLDGDYLWDLSGDLPQDVDLLFETLPVTGQWFEEEFPDGTYAVRLSAATDLLGVFQARSDALLLLGVVSPEDTGPFSRTRLIYDDPIKILTLPLLFEDSWASESIVSGSAQGFSTAYTERYSSEVDRRGVLKTPFGDFPVLRVRTELRRTSFGVTLATQTTFAFVTPCFGTIATIVSTDGETGEDFQETSEIRRLAP